MKLVQYWAKGDLRLGADIGADAIVDLQKASRALAKQEGKKAGLVLPDNMMALLEGGAKAMARAKAAVRFAKKLKKDGGKAAWLLNAKRTRLGPPVDEPRKIICIGQNYIDHVKEQNAEMPTCPIMFVKFATCVIGDGDAVIKPRKWAKNVDFEVELAVVIGKKAKNVAKKDAYKYVAGYTVVNDISARDIQFSDKQWSRGKSADTFCPMGPCLTTRDEIPDPQKLKLSLTLNGEVMQDSSTKNLIFKVPYLIEFLSKSITLLPGDIISTGTPPGVGIFRKPPVLLKDGDRMEACVEKIGVISNPVKDAVVPKKKKR
jgi:2-keto-4-pentenoate hydratase/2-oxohepta-3-ene-1,7-dioic acid hydratase in catechol pathway